jgi:hypothetical protein
MRRGETIASGFPMTTFCVQNFGCRATQADAALIESGLRWQGYARSESRGAAGVVVLNTCTVTAAADQQARQAIREIHRDNPETRIIVTGCYAQRAPEEIAALPGVSLVVGNAHQTEIAGLLAETRGLLALGLAENASGTPTGRADGFFPASQLQNGSGFPAAGEAKILTVKWRGATVFRWLWRNRRPGGGRVLR